MGLIRLLVFGFIGLSVIYLLISFYSRSVRREKLEKRWDAEPPEGVGREDYVERGMAEYEAGLRPKLILLVYIIPAVFIAAVLYLTNAN